jgi:hypothetical protein
VLCVGLWALSLPTASADLAVVRLSTTGYSYRATHYDCRPSVTSRHGQLLPIADRRSPVRLSVSVRPGCCYQLLARFPVEFQTTVLVVGWLPASTAPHRTTGVQYTLLSRRRSCTTAKIQVPACFQKQSTRGELKLHGFLFTSIELLCTMNFK